MFKAALMVFVVVVVFQGGNADSHSLGSCPEIDPLDGFKMNKFLGLWYVIQKTSTSTPCLVYNLTSTDKRGLYHITEIEQHSPFVSGLHHEHHTTGDLNVTDPSTPASMALDLPFDIGTTRYIVFMTNYYDYAAVFTCKKYPLIHKWSAEILSRGPKLNMDFVDKVRTRLSSYNIDPSTLSVINHEGCAPPGATGGLIKTASKIVGAVGETIEDINKPATL